MQLLNIACPNESIIKFYNIILRIQFRIMKKTQRVQDIINQDQVLKLKQILNTLLTNYSQLKTIPLNYNQAKLPESKTKSEIISDWWLIQQSSMKQKFYKDQESKCQFFYLKIDSRKQWSMQRDQKINFYGQIYDDLRNSEQQINCIALRDLNVKQSFQAVFIGIKNVFELILQSQYEQIEFDLQYLQLGKIIFKKHEQQGLVSINYYDFKGDLRWKLLQNMKKIATSHNNDKGFLQNVQNQLVSYNNIHQARMIQLVSKSLIKRPNYEQKNRTNSSTKFINNQQKSNGINFKQFSVLRRNKSLSCQLNIHSNNQHQFHFTGQNTKNVRKNSLDNPTNTKIRNRFSTSQQNKKSTILQKIKKQDEVGNNKNNPKKRSLTLPSLYEKQTIQTNCIAGNQKSKQGQILNKSRKSSISSIKRTINSRQSINISTIKKNKVKDILKINNRNHNLILTNTLGNKQIIKSQDFNKYYFEDRKEIYIIENGMQKVSKFLQGQKIKITEADIHRFKAQIYQINMAHQRKKNQKQKTYCKQLLPLKNSPLKVEISIIVKKNIVGYHRINKTIQKGIQKIQKIIKKTVYTIQKFGLQQIIYGTENPADSELFITKQIKQIDNCNKQNIQQFAAQIRQKIIANTKKQSYKKIYQEKFEKFKYSRKLEVDSCKNWLSLNSQCKKSDSLVERENLLSKNECPNQWMIESILATEYCSYFYFVSNIFRQVVSEFLYSICHNKMFFLHLRRLDSLEVDFQLYLNKIRQLFHLIQIIFKSIPVKAFWLSENEHSQIQNTIGLLQSRFQLAKKDWKDKIQLKFKDQIQQIKQVDKMIRIFPSIQNKPRQSEYLSFYKKAINQFESIIDLILQKKLYIYTSIQNKECKHEINYVLNTYYAKDRFYQEVSLKIFNIYLLIFNKMKEIGNQWSRLMARTERMLASQISHEQEDLIEKIQNLSSEYLKHFKKFFLERNNFYRLESVEKSMYIKKTSRQLSTVSEISMKLRISQISIKSIQQNPQPETNLQSNSQRTLMEKNINFLYQMNRRTKQKLIQIRKISKMHSDRIRIFNKSLEKEEIQMKNQFLIMTADLNRVMKQIKSRIDFFSKQQDMKNISKRHCSYLEKKKKLQVDMLQNDMIIWGDDQNFETNLEVCLKIINFVFSEAYRRASNQTLDVISLKTFNIFNRQFEKLKIFLINHRFQEYFKELDFSPKQIDILQMVIYKGYQPIDKNQFLQIGIDIRSKETSMKIIDLVNLYKANTSVYDKILQIFYRRKGEKYLNEVEGLEELNIYLQFSKEHKIYQIKNVENIIKSLSQKVHVYFWNEKVQQIHQYQINIAYKIEEYRRDIINHIIMAEQFDERYLKEEQMDVLNAGIQKFSKLYNQFIKITTDKLHFYLKQYSQYEWNCWLQLQNISQKMNNLKFKEKFHFYLSQVSSRMTFLTFDKCIQLMKWNTRQKIETNIKNLFPEISHIQISKSHEVLSIFVGPQQKDKVQIYKGAIQIPKVFDEPVINFIKFIQKNITDSIKLMVNNSIGRIGQIKIIALFLYFTEQVQTFIFMNMSLEYLYQQLNDKIKQIVEDLRYDISNHKEEEIGQINSFIHHIKDNLGSYPQIDGYQWLSTLKYYQKNKDVVIRQNKFSVNYGFQPKKTKIITNINRKLNLKIMYDQRSLMPQFELEAYALGAPLFFINNILNSFISCEKNTRQLLKTMEINTYFLVIQPTQFSTNKISKYQYRQVELEIMQRKTQRVLAMIHQTILIFKINKKRQDKYEAIQLQNEEDKLLGINISIGNQIEAKTPLFFVYDCQKLIPDTLKVLYSSRQLAPVRNDSLINLKIHILVHTHQMALSGSVRSELIWKLLQLKDIVCHIKSISSETVMKSLRKIIELIASQLPNQLLNTLFISGQVKNQITQIITTQCSIQYQNALEYVRQIFQESGNSSKELSDRQDLLNYYKQTIEEHMKSSLKPLIVVYGSQTTYKTTLVRSLIQNNKNISEIYEHKFLQVYYSQNSDYKSQEEIDDQQSMKLLHQDQSNKYQICEFGILEEINPAIFNNAVLIYIPGIKISPKYYRELYSSQFSPKIYRLLDNLVPSYALPQKNNIITNCTQKLWNFLTKTHKIRKNLNNNFFELHEILPILLQIISSILDQNTSSKSFQSENQFQIQEFLKSSKQQLASIQSLFVIFTAEYISVSISDKQLKKLFYNQVRKIVQEQPRFCNFAKTDNLYQMTFIITGEIIEANSIGRQKNKLAPQRIFENQSSRNILNLGFQRNLLKKYTQLGVSVILSFNNNFLYPSFFQDLKTFKPKNGYVLQTKAGDVENLLYKITQIRRLKTKNLNCSKLILSSWNFQKTKTVIFAEKQDQTKKDVYIVIDDVHLGQAHHFSFIKTIIEKDNVAFRETFIGFNNKNYLEKIPRRLMRHFININIPDIEISHIHRYKFKTVGEEQYNLVQILLENYDEIKNSYTSNFLLQISIKLPSQLYTKFVFIKFIQFLLTASTTLQLKTAEASKKYKGVPDIRTILTQMKRNQKIKEKFFRLMDTSIYLTDTNSDKGKKNINGDLIEIQTNVYKQKIKQLVKSLSVTEQAFCKRMDSYCQFILTKNCYFIYGDQLNLLPRMVSHLTQRVILQIESSNNFIGELLLFMQKLIQNNKVSAICVIPPYLSKKKKFMHFLFRILEGGEIIWSGYPQSDLDDSCHEQSYAGNQLWQFFCSNYKKKEYVENKKDEQIVIKEMIQDILRNRIIFFVQFQSEDSSLNSDEQNNQFTRQNYITLFPRIFYEILGIGQENKYLHALSAIKLINIEFTGSQKLSIFTQIIVEYKKKEMCQLQKKLKNSQRQQRAFIKLQKYSKIIKTIIKEIIQIQNLEKSLKIQDISEIIQILFQETSEYILHQKNQYLVFNYSEDAENQQDSILEQIQTLSSKIKELKKLENQLKDTNKKHQECQKILKLNIKQLEEREKVFKQEQKQKMSELKWSKYTKLIQKSSHISKQFTKIKTKFIEDLQIFNSEQKIIFEDIFSQKIPEQIKRITENLQLLKKQQKNTQNGNKIFFHYDNFILFGEIKNNFLQGFNNIPSEMIDSFQIEANQILDSHQGSIKQTHNCKSFFRCLKYMIEIQQYIQQKGKSQLKEIIMERKQYQQTNDKIMLEEIVQSIIRRQLAFSKYMNLIDSQSITQSILKQLNNKLKEIQQALQGLLHIIQFLLDFGEYQFFKIQFQADSNLKKGVKTEKKIKNIKQMFQQQDCCEFKLMRKETKQLSYKLYTLISSRILSKIRDNIDIHLKIRNLLEIPEERQQSVKIDGQYLYTESQKTIFNILFRKIIVFEKQMSNLRDEKNMIVQRRTKNVVNPKTIIDRSMIPDFCLKDAILQSYNRVMIPSGKNILQNKFQSELNKTELLQQKLVKFNFPFIIYDSYSLVTQFLKKFNRESPYKIFFVKNKNLSAFKEEQDFQLNEQFIEEFLKQPNHIPTFYLYYFSHTRNSKEQLQNLLKLISYFIWKNSKGKGFHDQLLILVNEEDLVQELQIHVLKYIQSKIPQNISHQRMGIKLYFTEYDFLQLILRSDLCKAGNNTEEKSSQKCDSVFSLFHDYQISQKVLRSQIQTVIEFYRKNLQPNLIQSTKLLQQKISACLTILQEHQEIQKKIILTKNYSFEKQYGKQNKANKDKNLNKIDFYLLIKKFYRAARKLCKHNLVPMNYIKSLTKDNFFEEIIQKYINFQNNNCDTHTDNLSLSSEGKFLLNKYMKKHPSSVSDDFSSQLNINKKLPSDSERNQSEKKYQARKDVLEYRKLEDQEMIFGAIRSNKIEDSFIIILYRGKIRSDFVEKIALLTKFIKQIQISLIFWTAPSTNSKNTVICDQDSMFQKQYPVNNTNIIDQKKKLQQNLLYQYLSITLFQLSHQVNYNKRNGVNQTDNLKLVNQDRNTEIQSFLKKKYVYFVANDDKQYFAEIYHLARIIEINFTSHL